MSKIETLSPSKANKNEDQKLLIAADLAEITLSQVLYALSDNNRLKIVQMIHKSGGELRCGHFAEKLGITKPTLSHHFGILRECGIIATRVDGTTKLNTLRRKELNARFPGLIDAVLKAI